MPLLLFCKSINHQSVNQSGGFRDRYVDKTSRRDGHMTGYYLKILSIFIICLNFFHNQMLGEIPENQHCYYYL